MRGDGKRARRDVPRSSRRHAHRDRREASRDGRHPGTPQQARPGQGPVRGRRAARSGAARRSAEAAAAPLLRATGGHPERDRCPVRDVGGGDRAPEPARSRRRARGRPQAGAAGAHGRPERDPQDDPALGSSLRSAPWAGPRGRLAGIGPSAESHLRSRRLGSDAGDAGDVGVRRDRPHRSSGPPHERGRHPGRVGVPPPPPEAFDSKERLALAAYLQGEASVREHGIFPSSRPYVDNILALAR